ITLLFWEEGAWCFIFLQVRPYYNLVFLYLRRIIKHLNDGFIDIWTKKEYTDPFQILVINIGLFDPIVVQVVMKRQQIRQLGGSIFSFPNNTNCMNPNYNDMMH
ncbi:hypothetical protein ACJX0J_006172, partial [Zea mays]